MYACVYVCVDSVCLAVYVANGHIMAFSLPSLKPLLDSDFLPFPDIRSGTATVRLYIRDSSVNLFSILNVLSYLFISAIQ